MNEWPAIRMGKEVCGNNASIRQSPELWATKEDSGNFGLDWFFPFELFKMGTVAKCQKYSVGEGVQPVGSGMSSALFWGEF